MAASSPALCRVLETSRVSPPPNSTPHEASLPLTFFDIVFLKATPVERIYFYHLRSANSHFLDVVLPNLTSSLSLALQHFYPLAGKIRSTPGSDERYELHYAVGDSVPLTLAQYDGADFLELSGSHARAVGGLLPLVPKLETSEAGRSVLALQVTLFPDKGVALGVTVDHAASDGSSTMLFLSLWASACRTGSGATAPQFWPSFDRSGVPDPDGQIYSTYMKLISAMGDPLPRTSKEPQSAPTSDLLFSTFVLGQDQIKQMRRWVMARAKERNATFHCSSIVVVYAYVWVCLVRAREYSSDGVAQVAFAADCRGRLTPPLSPAYFGSCIGAVFVDGKAADIGGADGFMAACEALGRAVERFKDGALDGVEGWLQKMSEMRRPMSVAGSPKFRVYDTDFGWGRPQKVEVMSIMNTGAISVAECREDDGGVEIGLVLSEQETLKFGTHFANSLKDLLAL